ncbi:M28 family peptidase [Clostridium sp.]|uniref:M28 family peptidase n=1 Tax=Clostridium sp. TaxID=1506 RepID=UPI0034639DCA
MKSIVDKLCSDKFEGRKIGSDGNFLAEEYLNEIFSSVKLEPVIENGFKCSYPYKQDSTFDKEIGKMKAFDLTANNIIGKISGVNSNKALVISAHFDHIGKEKDDIYRGAVDNASGIATLIQLAIYLKEDSLKKSFNYDVIFAAFNGEEDGLTGSRSFSDEISKSYDEIININIDSVGYKNGGNIAFFNTLNLENRLENNDKYNYTKLMNDIKLSLNKNGIECLEKDLLVGSDDKAFQEKGHTSISISEENIKEIIHTTNDTPEVIDYNRLDKIVYSLQYFINNYIDNLFIE